MTDMVTELRRKSKQATLAHPYVRVTGDFLSEVANELERLQRIEAQRRDDVLFGELEAGERMEARV